MTLKTGNLSVWNIWNNYLEINSEDQKIYVKG